MRSDRRERERKIQKFNKKVNKLTDAQIELIDLYAQQKADQLLDVFKELITESTTESMRLNRVSFKRIDKIFEQANKIMDDKIRERENEGDE